MIGRERAAFEIEASLTAVECPISDPSPKLAARILREATGEFRSKRALHPIDR
jgi:hypothetical protein